MNEPWYEYFRIQTPEIDEHLESSRHPTRNFQKPTLGSAAYWDSMSEYTTHRELSRAGPGAYYLGAAVAVGYVVTLGVYGESTATLNIAKNENISFKDKARFLQGTVPI